MIRNGKRVVLGYAMKNDARHLFDSPLFWPNTQHLWAETDNLDKLEQFIGNHVCGDRSSARKGAPYFRSVMAELTPSVEGVLLWRYHGLRELAQQVNVHYDEWFRRKWWKCANIVAADFFLGSDIVQIAIDANRKRFASEN